MSRIILFLVIFVMFACSDPYSYQKPGQARVDVYSVRYYVSGSSRLVSIRYRDLSGYSTVDKTPIPWMKELKFTEGVVVSISVRNLQSSGDINVKIYRDGELVANKSAFGGYGFVTVSVKL